MRGTIIVNVELKTERKARQNVTDVSCWDVNSESERRRIRAIKRPTSARVACGCIDSDCGCGGNKFMSEKGNAR